MIGYQGAVLEVYKEALRTVPALLACKNRQSQSDAQMLINSYMAEAAGWEVDRSTAWSVLFAASQNTNASLVQALAVSEGTCEDEIVERMVGAAQDAVSSSAL